jgi:hypothetical protein
MPPDACRQEPIMTCADVKRRIEEQLSSIEAEVREARRIVEADLPSDVLLSTIGAIQVLLEGVAAAVPGLSGRNCWIRLSPEEFSAEFEQTFRVRLRVCRNAGCQPPKDEVCGIDLAGLVGKPNLAAPSPSVRSRAASSGGCRAVGVGRTTT